jgi:NADH:ubiquinone oxidoreductase subunit E
MADLPIIAPMLDRQRKRQAPKGRRVDASALAEVQRLLGDAPRRRELLIEHLHRLQDALDHLPAAHLAALAQELRLSIAEVFEGWHLSTTISTSSRKARHRRRR